MRRHHYALMLSKSAKKPLLPPTMKDFASCFSEHAVRVSDSSCSGGSSAIPVLDPSVQSSLSSLYRANLSTHKSLLINVSWSKTHIGPTLSLVVNSSGRKPRAMTHWVLREKAGSQSFLSGGSVVVFYWDISSAKYTVPSSPEPAHGFYIVVLVDKELAFSLGDTSLIQGFADTMIAAEFSMVRRREQVVGNRVLYSTKARFRHDGGEHDISIRCQGGSIGSELVVCVDQKRVVHVMKLEYNFRGNQTLFVDGSPVDLMWDVHDWWFSNPLRNGVFLFRARSRMESRLWLEEEEEEVMCKEKGVGGFSLLIEAVKVSVNVV